MVRIRIMRRILAGSALLALTVPARTEGTLEKMQDEVAAIARRTRGAVVTIEEERALMTSQVNSKTLSSLYASAAQQDPNTLKADISRLTKKQEDLEDQRTALLQMYTQNSPKVKQNDALLDNNRKRLDAYRKAEQVYQSLSYDRIYASLPKSGSGFSIGDGYVVTTADVLEGMQHPVVVTDNGTRIKAKVLGINTDLNIGLVQLLAKADLPGLKLGDSASVAVGHFAVTIGNQSGQANSVALMLVGGIRTEGTYSGSHFYPSLIQIAGTVGQGTSGAPLVNARGEVIGIMAGAPTSITYWNALPTQNSLTLQPGSTFYAPPAITTEPAKPVTPQPGQQGKAEEKSEKKVPVLGDIPIIGKLFWNSQNVTPMYQPRPAWVVDSSPVTSAGFAIPINELKPVIDDLRAGKVYRRVWIGISPKDEDSAVERDNIIEIHRDVKIEGVYPDSPAFRAGIQPGDIVLSLNGKRAENASDVREASVRMKVGDKLAMQVRRGGETLNITLTIESRPDKIKPPITAPVKEGF